MTLVETYSQADDGIPEPRWFGGYDCYQLPCGEYTRSGAQWSFEKVVAESKPIRRYPTTYLYGSYLPTMRVQAKLHIGGKSTLVKDDEWGKRRYRATCWGLRLEVGRHTMTVVTGARCTSLKDAQRQADAILDLPFEGFETPLAAFLKQVYSPGWLTTCIYRLKDDVPLHRADRWSDAKLPEEAALEPSNWEPWYTDLKTGGEWAPREWGTGYFLEVHRSRHYIKSIRVSVDMQRASLIHRTGMCTSGTGSPKYTELARLLGGMWTPDAPELRPPTKPVTDPDLDAPDGAVVDGYRREGDEWVRIDD